MKKFLIVDLIIALCLLTTSVFADYAIIVDAGSSGSRLHLFQYTKTAGIPEIKDIFSESIKPGLSSYANNPEAAGTSLKKLLDDVSQKLQEIQVDPHQVTLNIFGTAGMRLLSPDSQQVIYANVSNYIKRYYAFNIDKINTISGDMEGLFGWLDVNYLKENFQHHLPTVGSIDMGGASTQITFATQDTSKPTNEKTIKVGEQTYTVFNKSFLGLGQDQARATISTGNTAYTCYPKDYPLNATTVGNFNFATCQHLYSDFLTQHQVTQALILPQKTQNFIAYSGIFYAYDFIGASKHPDLASVENRIQTICTEPWTQLQHDYPKIPLAYLSSYCANSTYIDDLLYGAYRLEGSQLTVTNKIGAQDIDWTLGALLYSLTSTPAKTA